MSSRISSSLTGAASPSPPLSGRHQGDFNGHNPTGKAFKVRGMQIGRFVDGRMVERWGSSDELGILKQIGAIEG